MSNSLKTPLVCEALRMALQRRPPGRVIHHSDHGCQYTSDAFAVLCSGSNVRVSMGSVGDCYGNAMIESFFVTLECELFDRKHFRTHQDTRREIFTYIEGWYNPYRLHSSLDCDSPMQHEERIARSVSLTT